MGHFWSQRPKVDMEVLMEKIIYTQEKMNLVRRHVQELIAIVHELESDFPGRHFTLDGHLLSIMSLII